MRTPFLISAASAAVLAATPALAAGGEGTTILAVSHLAALQVIATGAGHSWCQPRLHLIMALDSSSPAYHAPKMQEEMMDRLGSPIHSRCPAATAAELVVANGATVSPPYEASAPAWRFVPAGKAPAKAKTGPVKPTAAPKTAKAASAKPGPASKTPKPKKTAASSTPGYKPWPRVIVRPRPTDPAVMPSIALGSYIATSNVVTLGQAKTHAIPVADSTAGFELSGWLPVKKAGTYEFAATVTVKDHAAFINGRGGTYAGKCSLIMRLDSANRGVATKFLGRQSNQHSVVLVQSLTLDKGLFKIGAFVGCLKNQAWFKLDKPEQRISWEIGTPGSDGLRPLRPDDIVHK